MQRDADANERRFEFAQTLEQVAGIRRHRSGNGAGVRITVDRRNRPVIYNVGNSVRPMPVSCAASTSASDIAAGSAYGAAIGLMMQIVEFANLRVTRFQHLDVELCGDRVEFFGSDATGERVHHLAPGPETVVGIRLALGEAGHRALERVRMEIRHARQHVAAEPTRIVARARATLVSAPTESLSMRTLSAKPSGSHA